MNKYWFGKKRIGYGVRPSSWEGWVTLLAFVAVTLGSALCLLPRGETFTFAVIFVISLVIFITLCMVKFDRGEDENKGEE